MLESNDCAQLTRLSDKYCQKLSGGHQSPFANKSIDWTLKGFELEQLNKLYS